MLAHVLAVPPAARGAQPAPCGVRPERISLWHQRPRAGQRPPDVTRCTPSHRRCSSPSPSKLYMAVQPSPLEISMQIHQVSVSRANMRTTHRPDRPSHTHSLAPPSVLPQTTLRPARRRADELLAGGASCTSSWTTAGAVARSGPGQCASRSACCRSGDHHRGRMVHVGACESCGRRASTGLCGHADG